MMQTINLTQNNFKMPPIVYMVQNDTGRSLKMILDDVTLAGTETGAVAIRRSDGSYYTITATLVAADNAFTIEADQALTQPGKTECQLKVTYSNNDVISSYTFCIMVQPSTDGVPEEQLGISAQDLIDAAAQLVYANGDTKTALLQIAEKTAYIDANGQDYYDALFDALYPPVRATSVTLNKNSLVFGSSGVSETLTASVLPNNHEDTVVWGTSDSSVAVVSDGIVTSVGNGSATIYATCGPVHASASVIVSGVTLESISATYTQSGTVYDTDSLDSLTPDLVVTATWSDASTTIVPSTAYTLSGTLEWGTSTITVEYGGKTDTFSVTVSWVYTLTAFRACNSAWSGSLIDTKLETTSNNKRASSDPVACILKAGTYEISCPSAFYFGPHLASAVDADPTFEGIDFTNTGAIKTFWTGTATRLLSGGWQQNSYTMTVSEDALFACNFKIGSAGTTAFNSTYLAQLLAGFTVTRIA